MSPNSLGPFDFYCCLQHYDICEKWRLAWIFLNDLCCVYLVVQSCLTFCNPMDCSPPGSSVHEDSPGKNTRVGCHALLQGIFPTQGSNRGLLHYKQILYYLSHQGSPRILEWVACPFSRGSSWPGNQTRVSCMAGRFFTSWVIREAQKTWKELMLDWYASSLSAPLIRRTGTVLLSMDRASLRHYVLKWSSTERVVLFVLFKWFYILEQF